MYPVQSSRGWLLSRREKREGPASPLPSPFSLLLTQYSTKRWIVQLALVRLHVLVVLSILALWNCAYSTGLVLALVGQMPDDQAGWVTCPPQVVMVAPRGRHQRRSRRWQCARSWPWATWGRYLAHTVHLPVLRSGLVWALWHLSGQSGPGWVSLVPWGAWLWHSAGLPWPWLQRQPEWRGVDWLLGQVQRGLLLGYGGLVLIRVDHSQPLFLQTELSPTFTFAALDGREAGFAPLLLGMSCPMCQREEPWVEVVPEPDGSYTATLCGHFTLRVGSNHPFRKRLLLLFLRLLEVPGGERGSCRTRDGRTPFVRQQYLAQAFAMPQPDISRLERYWLAGDWANLLSLKTEEVLTQELRARIMEVFATFPWWGMEQVYQHLRAQEVRGRDPRRRSPLRLSGKALAHPGQRHRERAHPPHQQRGGVGDPPL